MKTKQNNAGASHIPAQETGSEMNVIEKIELESEAQAIQFFQIVKVRMLDVNRWSEFAGIISSDFSLTDFDGLAVNRIAKNGDYIKINIPGPGTKTGGGYDWVIIEDIKFSVLDDIEVLSMTARPSSNPLKDEANTAHFLKEEATSTFQVKRIGNTIYAEEHGRNELPNTETDRPIDNIRNTFVGLGAKVGFSYPQWKALVKGLLDQNRNSPHI